MIKKKVEGYKLFDTLDDLFDIPKKQAKEQKSKEELIKDFEDYIKGA